MNGDYRRKAAAACAVLKDYQEPLFIKYEWEELLARLSSSEDPQLRGIGIREQKLSLTVKHR